MDDLNSQLAALGVTPIDSGLQDKLSAMGIKPANISGSYPASSTPSVGTGEAGLRALEQGATVGWGSELNGGIQALLQKYAQGSPPDLIDLYRQNRDLERQKFEAAEQAHPTISKIGNVAGAIIPALATGGGSLAEEGLVGAAELGAKYGAVNALGQSKADLTDPTLQNLTKAAKETAGGAALGYGTGAAAGILGKTLGPSLSALGKKLFGAGQVATDLGPVSATTGAFNQGLQGRRLFGDTANRALSQENIAAVKGVSDTIQNELTQAGQGKLDLLNSSDSGVNLGDWMGGFNQALESAQKSQRSPSALSDLEKVRKMVYSHLLDEQGGKGLTISPNDVELLKRDLGAMGSEGDSPLTTEAGRALVNRVVSPLNRNPNIIEQGMSFPENFQPLKSTLETAVPGLGEQNAQISQLLKAQEAIPKATDIANQMKYNMTGANAAEHLNEFYGELPPDLQDKLKGQFQSLGQANKVAQKIAEPSLLGGFFPAKKMLYGGANVAGLVSRSLYDVAPEQLQNLAKTIATGGGEAGNKLAGVLAEAANRDHTGRNALLFAVQQNPAYRDLISKAMGDANNGQQ
jgi:hypothetical protein